MARNGAWVESPPVPPAVFDSTCKQSKAQGGNEMRVGMPDFNFKHYYSVTLFIEKSSANEKLT